MDLDKLTIDRGSGPRRADRSSSRFLGWGLLAGVLGVIGYFAWPLLPVNRPEPTGDVKEAADAASAKLQPESVSGSAGP
ncbi:MAG: hypothetical protein AAGG01_12215, partial [Planctomycetota bacterium]